MKKNKKQLNQTSTSRQLRKSARFDLFICIIVVFLLTLLTMSFEIELVESLYDYTRKYEEWDLDEILFTLFWVGLAAIFYGIRRMADIKKLNKQVTLHAYFDPITQLPNRILAIERLHQLVSSAKRKKKNASVLFLDFDNFKMINDTYGHAKGDLLLKSVGERLSSHIRIEDTVARLGGDEFVILLDCVNSAKDVLKLVKRIVDYQQVPHIFLDSELFISFSIGIAMYPKDGETPDELLKAADVAMYRAKDQGKARFHFYSEELGNELIQRYKLELNLKNAISRNEFYLVYQPQINFSNNTIIGYEALLRWEHEGQLISPEIFIGIAEEIGLISTIGEWVLENAILNATQWIQPDEILAINISSKQLQHDNFINIICNILKKSDLAPSSLELEITETALLTEFSKTTLKLEALQAMGVNIAIDDFGAGYSSLGRLKDLKVDKLKIDKSFIDNAVNQDTDQKIIKTIVSLAHHLELELIAEGVENVEQALLLQSLNCDHMQGYFFSHPIKQEQIKNFNHQFLNQKLT